jgi:MFS transporter, DHA1 family, tetracycline resistance protein
LSCALFLSSSPLQTKNRIIVALKLNMKKIANPIPFVFVTVLIDCIGIGIIFPIAASIVTEVSKVSVVEATTYSGWIMASYACMQFICSPLLGGISDRYGRRPVLLLSLFGLGIDYLFLATATTLPLLFIGRIIAGVCGASLQTSFAYIADVSPPEKRAQNFGLMGAAFGIGFIIGPIIGGIFSEFGSRVPFLVAASLSLLNWLYGFFILPESLKQENRRAFDLKRANPFGAFIQLKKNKEIRALVLVMFLFYLAGQVMPSTWAFFTKYRFNWADKEIGYSLAFVGVMISIVQGGLIKFAKKKLGTQGSVYVGMVMYIIGLALFAFITQAWMVYVFTLIYCLGGIAPPTLQAIISAKMPANEQGELQGMMTSLTSLSTILSPLIMTHLFYFFTNDKTPFYFPGAAFALAAIIVGLGLLICMNELKKDASPLKQS